MSINIQRAGAIVEEMQLEKSIESISQKTKINASTLYENKYPKILPQHHELAEQDVDLGSKEYVDQEIVIEWENEVTDEGACAFQIDD